MWSFHVEAMSCADLEAVLKKLLPVPFYVDKLHGKKAVGVYTHLVTVAMASWLDFLFLAAARCLTL